jgi:hypothetical protein
LKPAWANSSQETLSGKNPSQKRAGGVAQEVGLSPNPSTAKKKRKKKRNAHMYIGPHAGTNAGK